MDENDTARRLKRIPLEKMEELIDIKNFKNIGSPTVYWGDSSFDIGHYWKRDLEIHRWRVKLLEDNGWTFEEFFIENEKKILRTIVNDFNSKLTVPLEFEDRLKVFFPNARIIPARLELE